MNRNSSASRKGCREGRECPLLERLASEKRTPGSRAVGKKQRQRKNQERHAGKDPALRAGTKVADYQKAGQKGVERIIARHQAIRNGD